jgi:DNA-directed RNA polymerase subunit RPC12/RpoP
MNRAQQCAICGESCGCGMMVMGQYICLDCQALLDDPKRRVLGCSSNRRIAAGRAENRMELAKAKE